MRRTVLYSGFIGRLVVMTVSASLAIVILRATAFAQGNASQDQYTNEPTQSDPSTAPATETPGSDSSASASPDVSQKSPTPDSTAPATDSPTSESTTAPATDTPAPDTTAPSAPNASQNCPWEPIPPGAYPGGPSGCPWWRELPGGSESLGNGQCYDTHLGVTYSCSGESQTPNPGGPGGQTPNPGHPGSQTPNPVNPGIQTPNPGYAGGSNVIRQIESFLNSLFTGIANLQKQGPHDQWKDSPIPQIAKHVNPINNGLFPRMVGLLNPIIVGPGSIGLFKTVCTVFPDASICQGTTNLTNPSSGGNSARNTGGGTPSQTKLQPDFAPSKDSDPSAKMKPRQGPQPDKPDQKPPPTKEEQKPSATKKEQKPPITTDGWTRPVREDQATEGSYAGPGYGPEEGDHKGPDLYAVDFLPTAKDPAVYPTRPGKVVFAAYNCDTKEDEPPCYGNVVVIDHGDGLYSMYAHLKDPVPPPKVGDEVTTSRPIGTMGDTGCQGVCGENGQHLHFAVHQGPPNLTGRAALFQEPEMKPVRTPWTE
jgi:murein DD-endopeptidase MepM/ murein hydrolase activator NlpD